MLETLIVVLVILWLLGMVSSYTLGGFIHILLVVLWLLGMVSSYTLGGFLHLLLVLAVAVVLIRVIQGRNPV